MWRWYSDARVSDENEPQKSKHTMRGFGPPSPDSDSVPERAHRELPPTEGNMDEETIVQLPPFVEVELVYERAHPGMQQKVWPALEIWTRNRVYVCDWEMTCIEVRDRKSGRATEGHPLLRAHLAGGQKSEADHMEMTYPCPRPGTEAVFEHAAPRKGFVNTSTVERVVLRLRVLTVPHERLEKSWEEISGSHDVPERR